MTDSQRWRLMAGGTDVPPEFANVQSVRVISTNKVEYFHTFSTQRPFKFILMRPVALLH